MINLEVWVPPDYDLTKSLNIKYVHECGSICRPGRFGWYVPLGTLPKILVPDEDIHWSKFKNKDFVSYFDVTDPILLGYVKKHTLEKDGGG